VINDRILEEILLNNLLDNRKVPIIGGDDRKCPTSDGIKKASQYNPLDSGVRKGDDTNTAPRRVVDK